MKTYEGRRSKMDRNIVTMMNRILAARGQIPSDLVLKKGKVINVFSCTVEPCDVAVHEGVIVGLGEDYQGREEISLDGQWVIPGLIDGHFHIESSMLLPTALSAALLPHGTTSLIADPHEIGNVMGVDGIRFMLDESKKALSDIFFMAPSCVPATSLETSGARLMASDLARFKDEPRVLGLGEMMNFPGVLMGDSEVLEKILQFKDRVIDGHAPGLTGRDLQAYIGAGIRSDHETTTFEEGAEKVKRGMMLMIREGTSARNLKDLLPLVTRETARRFCLVSDDLHPGDILRRGHLDFVIREGIQRGLDPILGVQMATLNPAEYFGLKDRGAVAPGYRADIVVLKDLEKMQVERVYKNGSLAVDHGRLVSQGASRAASAMPSRPLNMAPIGPESFRIQDRGLPLRVIRIIPGQILTDAVEANMPAEQGWILPDVGADIIKLGVLERHRATGRIGLGLVQGLGIREGAMASSVAHDSHNVIAAGTTDEDLYRVAETVKEMGGGMAVSRKGHIIARVPLEVAGLMSTAPIKELDRGLKEVNRAAASLGCRIPEPFMTLSFLALPVIPRLKLTDKGLVDVERFKVISLYKEDG